MFNIETFKAEGGTLKSYLEDEKRFHTNLEDIEEIQQAFIPEGVNLFRRHKDREEYRIFLDDDRTRYRDFDIIDGEVTNIGPEREGTFGAPDNFLCQPGLGCTETTKDGYLWRDVPKAKWVKPNVAGPASDTEKKIMGMYINSAAKLNIDRKDWDKEWEDAKKGWVKWDGQEWPDLVEWDHNRQRPWSKKRTKSNIENPQDPSFGSGYVETRVDSKGNIWVTRQDPDKDGWDVEFMTKNSIPARQQSTATKIKKNKDYQKFLRAQIPAYVQSEAKQIWDKRGDFNSGQLEKGDYYVVDYARKGEDRKPILVEAIHVTTYKYGAGGHVKFREVLRPSKTFVYMWDTSPTEHATRFRIQHRGGGGRIAPVAAKVKKSIKSQVKVYENVAPETGILAVGPDEFASDLPIGTEMKGQDGNMWVVTTKMTKKRSEKVWSRVPGWFKYLGDLRRDLVKWVKW